MKPIDTFCNLFFTLMAVSPMPITQAGLPPLVVRPRLLIQYIHSYPLLLVVVPPSATEGCAMLL
jgi:hypothetical protein